MGDYVDGPTLSTLKSYSVLVWFTGESYDDTDRGIEPGSLTAIDQTNLKSFLDSGGSLFLSGQDILWDVTVNSFVSSYLGVLSASEDKTYAATVHGATGDTVSDGLIFVSFDADSDGYVDSFPTSDLLLSEESGTFIWDTSYGEPGHLIFSPTFSSVSAAFLAGSYLISHLSNTELIFGSCELWAAPDENTGPFYDWYHTGYAATVNQYCIANLSPSSKDYWTKEFGNLSYQSYPDYITSIPAYAHTLLVTDPGGNNNIVGVRGEKNTWKIIFLPFPFEGLGIDDTRRTFLYNSLNWLKE